MSSLSLGEMMAIWYAAIQASLGETNKMLTLILTELQTHTKYLDAIAGKKV